MDKTVYDRVGIRTRTFGNLWLNVATDARKRYYEVNENGRSNK